MIDEIRVKFNYVRILNNTRTARPRERKAERIGGAKFGKNYNHITTYWNSEFSDGTPLGIITSNYGIDPVYNRIVDDHLNLLYIK